MSIFAQFCWVLVEFSNFRNFLLDEFYSNLKSRVESAFNQKIVWWIWNILTLILVCLHIWSGGLFISSVLIKSALFLISRKSHCLSITYTNKIFQWNIKPYYPWTWTVTNRIKSYWSEPRWIFIWVTWVVANLSWQKITKMQRYWKVGAER